MHSLCNFKNGFAARSIGSGVHVMVSRDQEEVIRQIVGSYDIAGDLKEIESLVNGHINDTYHICFNKAGHRVQYILQKINRYVFKDPVKVMSNIQAVSGHLAGKQTAQDCAVIHFLENRCGQNYTEQDGEFWRICPFVEHSVAYETVENGTVLESAGYAFGRFQELLSDLPMERLYETIPGFHDTPARLDALFAASESDPAGRTAAVEPELRFFQENRTLAGTLADWLAHGDLPLRVTHNDTKYNNILMDERTGRPLCVIDLDTVMPGLSMYDFGDAIRFAANRAVEDETDLARVGLNMTYYEAFTRGFMTAAGAFLTEREIEGMALGAVVITIELASRFLADYLLGDRYFRIHRPGQNLDRARSQIRLAQDMIGRLDQMNALVRRYAC